MAAAALAGCVAAPGDRAMQSDFPPVAIQGDWFTVGGEKLLVVAVGYEACGRPGQAPWKTKFEPEVMREDFRRIRAMGCNTIRTWNTQSDEELQLAAEAGLWVIQGLWIKADADFNDPAFRKESLAFYEREITRLARHPNILCYLLLNEPHGSSVHKASPQRMNEFYREIVAVARRCDPKRRFSYSNCVHTDFMVPAMWDFTAQNVYPYAPTTIEKSLGYRGYMEWVKRALAPGKPLLVTEYGLSVSPHGDGRGYGGNTLDQQRDGVVRMTDDLLAAGAAGYCTFMWLDGWWKAGDPETHDPGAEEWYGLLEVDSDYQGRPRPVYYAMQDYNKAVRVLPRDGAFVSHTTPVELWAPEARAAEYRIDDGPWQPLARDGANWWRGEIDFGDRPEGAHYVWTRGIDADGHPCGVKSALVVLDRSERPADFLRVRMLDLPTKIRAGTELVVTVQVTDRAGRPAVGKKVRVDRFLNTGWEERGVDVETDDRGRALADLGKVNDPGIISVSAAATYASGLIVRRHGDYGHVEVVGR
jgi:hypothetical protein